MLCPLFDKIEILIPGDSRSILPSLDKLFRCSVTNAKRSFNRSVNAIFGKVGRIASEEVTLQLVKSKCLPILLYGLEC